MIASFEKAEAYISDIPRFTTKNEPEKTKEFLNYLGDVSKTVKTIHIAGTNGKGSVCAYLRAGLVEEGLKVAMFTSPHLVDIRERFLINNEMISKEDFVDSLNTVIGKVNEFNEMTGDSTYHPTFFEILFFMAVVWCGEERPDVLLLETGLGGRLDATNSIESPSVCVITEIGLDHMEYLGDTKEKIAFEKAGIIKPCAPVVFVDKGEAWSKVIKSRCEAIKTDYYGINAQNINFLESSAQGIDFSIHNRYDDSAEFMLNTRAFYQVENAMLAYEALCCFYEKCNNPHAIQNIPKAFSKMVWPGRMEEIAPGVIIDGAHNEDGVNAFLTSVKQDKADKRTLLFSAVSDKQIEHVASLIITSRLFDVIYICHMNGYRAADKERMLEAFSKAECPVEYFDSTFDGVKALINDARSGINCYAAGSLYLVGEIKACLEEALKND